MKKSVQNPNGENRDYRQEFSTYASTAIPAAPAIKLIKASACLPILDCLRSEWIKSPARSSTPLAYISVPAETADVIPCARGTVGLDGPEAFPTVKCPMRQPTGTPVANMTDRMIGIDTPVGSCVNESSWARRTPRDSPSKSWWKSIAINSDAVSPSQKKEIKTLYM